jgi:CRP/FNR family transcriptional regulator
MRTLCLPVGLTDTDIDQLEGCSATGRSSRKGDALFRNGAPFTALYAVKLGSLKTTVLSNDGREQVSGYHMAGDLLGLDGMGDDRHGCEAIALEDSELCVIPFTRIEELARHVPALQHNLHKFMSREIERDHRVMLLLGSMRAEERLAAFLLNLSERYKTRGYSSTEFVLRMTREEIGSYLGPQARDRQPPVLEISGGRTGDGGGPFDQDHRHASFEAAGRTGLAAAAR